MTGILSISDLVPTQNLSRKDRNVIDGLKASIIRGNYIEPIKVDGNKIKDGHHRYLAYKELGLRDIPVQSYKKGGEPSVDKAKKMLQDGTAHGHPLTSAQRNYFAGIAGTDIYGNEPEKDDTEEMEEYKRGGGLKRGPKGYTSKNIKTSINEITMKRNELIFGPHGRKYFKPFLQGGENHSNEQSMKKINSNEVAFPQQPTAAQFYNRGFVPNSPVGFYQVGGEMTYAFPTNGGPIDKPQGPLDYNRWLALPPFAKEAYDMQYAAPMPPASLSSFYMPQPGDLPGEQWNVNHIYGPDIAGYNPDGTPIYRQVSQSPTGRTPGTIVYGRTVPRQEFVSGFEEEVPVKQKKGYSANTAAMQKELNAVGANLIVDGIWGPKTQAAYDKYMGKKAIPEREQFDMDQPHHRRQQGGQMKFGGLPEAFPQQPDAMHFFSGFPWQPHYKQGGVPCYNCGGQHMDMGGSPFNYGYFPATQYGGGVGIPEADTNMLEMYKKGGNWLKGAVNPAHKGYCTPMTKPTCTGHRKAFAKMMKEKHGFHKKAEGGEAPQGFTMDNVLDSNKAYFKNYIAGNTMNALHDEVANEFFQNGGNNFNYMNQQQMNYANNMLDQMDQRGAMANQNFLGQTGNMLRNIYGYGKYGMQTFQGGGTYTDPKTGQEVPLTPEMRNELNTTGIITWSKYGVNPSGNTGTTGTPAGQTANTLPAYLTKDDLTNWWAEMQKGQQPQYGQPQYGYPQYGAGQPMGYYRGQGMQGYFPMNPMGPYYKTKFKGWSNYPSTGYGYMPQQYTGAMTGAPSTSGEMDANQLAEFKKYWADRGVNAEITQDVKRGLLGKWLGPRRVKTNVKFSSIPGQQNQQPTTQQQQNTQTPQNNQGAGLGPTFGPGYSGFNADADGNGMPDYLQVNNQQGNNVPAANYDFVNIGSTPVDKQQFMQNKIQQDIQNMENNPYLMNPAPPEQQSMIPYAEGQGPTTPEGWQKYGGFRKRGGQGLRMFINGGDGTEPGLSQTGPLEWGYTNIEKRKMGLAPGTADWIIAGEYAGANMFNNMLGANRSEKKAMENWMKSKQGADANYYAMGMDKGDHTKDVYGTDTLMPDQIGVKVEPWAMGQFQGNRGDAYYQGKFGGSMAQGGQSDEVYMTENEIKQFMAMGGRVEFLD